MTTLIVDANNMAHRARHSYQLSFRGKDTSVTYGTLRMLMALIKEVGPDSIIMCFDGGAPAYRKKASADYKANRHHDDDVTYVEFIRQLNELEHMLPEFGVMTARRAGIEADDLMYHASRLVKGKSMICTNDDDLLQAVNDNVSVLKPGQKGNTTITPSNFEKVTGFHPSNWLIAKVLMGDSSDNLHGCHGIGPKTAVKMFRQIVQVDNGLISYDNKDISKQQQERLSEFFRTDYHDLFQVVNLAYDLTGARTAVVRGNWKPYSNKTVYQYCFSNAFVSLTESGSLGAMFGRLSKPVFETEGWRFPRIWSTYRSPQ